jgi:hypothetical protein
MNEPSKYHIVMSTGNELFNAVNWLDSTNHPYSEVPPMSYNPSRECIVMTDEGPVCLGLNYIVLRETMSTYNKRIEEE